VSAAARHLRRCLRHRDDSGAAIIEFIVIFVVLIVPITYFVLAVFDVQRNSFAATNATREAARVFVTAPNGSQGAEAARAAAALAFQDHGLDVNDESLRLVCSADPCLTPGATVTATYDTVVSLPFVPTIGDHPLAGISIHASHTVPVDSYAPARP
jgi:Flp pilus assembly protein TadG